MSEKTSPPDTDFQIRCPKLGHQITFSYCQTENQGIPCAKAIGCWSPYFQAEDFFRAELSPEEWQQAFEQSVKPKMLSLAELIAQAQKTSTK